MKNKFSVKHILSFLWVPLLLTLVVLPIILPYFHAGYFPTHDGEWAVVRLGDMFREIRDHQFPPRYSGNLNYGYGYPLFNFAYPLPYYIGLVIHLLKFSFINSIKLSFAGSVVLSVAFMYLAAKEFWGNRFAGFVSALLFAYLPYRLVDLYARGSIGESFAFIFFSFLFYAGVKVYKQPRSVFAPLIGFGIAGLVLSHNIMATFFLPVFLLFFGAIVWKDYKKYLLPFGFSVFLGLALSAFFWLPALAEKHLILLAKIPIADRSINYVTVQELLFRPWGYGLPETATGGFTYQIGWPQLFAVVIILGLLVFTFLKKAKTFAEGERAVGVLLLALLVMVLLLFPFTDSIWKHTPLLKEINYPWTLLGPIGFIISFLAGYICSVKNNTLKITALGLGILAVLLYLPYARPEKFTYHDNNYYFTNDATTTSSSEYTPLWVKERPLSRVPEKVIVVSGTGTISNLSFTSKDTRFQVAMATKGVVRINTIYYPGWKISIDGKYVTPEYNNAHGVMDVAVSAGDHAVSAVFVETPLRFAADLISVCAACLVLLWLGFSLRIKKL